MDALAYARINYAEAAYYDGNHCQHVSAFIDHLVWEERRKRLNRLYASNRTFPKLTA